MARTAHAIARWQAILALIAAVTILDSTADAQPCVGDCSDDGSVQINELILGVNIALGTAALAECPNLDNGEGEVTIDRLILAVSNALNDCGVSPTPGTPTPTATPGSGTPTPTGELSVSMWTVDDYEITDSECAGTVEDSVINALEERGPDFAVRRSGDQVEIEDSDGNVVEGTVDPDGTVRVEQRESGTIVTCEYDVDIQAFADLDESPTTATYDGDVAFSGFCLGFDDCSLQITARWQRVEGE
jgi:hypothetical protein